MRKTSEYARKRRVMNTYNGAEWLNTITKCRPYDDQPLPGAIVKETSMEAAIRAVTNVRLGFAKIQNNPEDGEYCFDLLAHATGVAKVRFAQIGGNECEPVKIIDKADDALLKVRARYVKWGKWELLKSEVDAIAEALDLYEMALMNSSPAQMSDAVEIRQKLLIEQRKAA
jgi:hypothetical protein